MFQVRARCRPNKLLHATAQSAAREQWRWASQSNMSSELNHSLYCLPKHWGANSAAASEFIALCGSAPQLRSSQAAVLRRYPVTDSVVVPSPGAKLRSSSRRSGGIASAFASRRCAVVRSEGPVASGVRLCWSARLPNKSLVPTPVTNAPSLRSSRGAAHLRRYVAKS